MLADIAIENLGVIDHAAVEFSPGLSVLTGETGAGKTMVLTGLRLLNGGRADASRVRTGTTQATVTGSFLTQELQPAAQARALDVVAQAGGSDDDGEVIVTRAVSNKGRSKAHLGGRSAPAASLANFAAELLTIHGQHDQLQLLHAEQQRRAVDQSDPALAAAVAAYESAYQHWKQLRTALDALQESSLQRAQDADRLQYAIQEIDEIDPQPDEDTQLVAEIQRLQDVDAFRETLLTALTALDGAEAFGDYGAEAPGAIEQVGQAEATLTQRSDTQLQQLVQELAAAGSTLSDVSSELNQILSELPTDASRLEAALQRQQDLKKLTRKYAPDIAGVLQWREKAERKLASLDISPAALEQREQEVADAWQEVQANQQQVSKLRTQVAARLSNQLTAELQGLAMPKVRFEVALHPCDPGPHGAEQVEFLLQANPQAPAQPVAQAASGGELSRVMLALEVTLSSESQGSTIVFDEIDAGVGGKAAVEIGRRLAQLARTHQVIVVTHLPQVAAYATTHLLISKDTSGDEVRSEVTTLTEEQRVAELARMLAGLDDSDTGRAHAQELFEKAQAEVTALAAR